LDKKILLLISAFILTIILASLALGTKLIVRTNNKDFQKDPEFYKSLGNHRLGKSDYVNAINAYETSLLLGEDADVRNNLAIIYHDQGEYTKALNQLRALINLKPENPSYHYDLAINLVDRFRNTAEQNQADLEEALAEFEKANTLQPGYSHSRENIDVLKRILGES